MNNVYVGGELVSVKWYGSRVALGDKVEFTLTNETVVGTVERFTTHDVVLVGGRRLYCLLVNWVKILEKK